MRVYEVLSVLTGDVYLTQEVGNNLKIIADTKQSHNREYAMYRVIAIDTAKALGLEGIAILIEK